MNIFNTNNRIVISIYYGTKKLTDPLLNPIRNLMPNFGGLDSNLLREYFFSYNGISF